MAAEQQEPVYKQIRNLLTVLVTGVACAAAFTGTLLYYYGPTGIYKLGNVIVSPSIMEGESYADQNSSTGQVSRFTFDKIEFSYVDPKTHQWNKLPVSPETYRRFYERFASEASLGTVEDAAVNKFHAAPPSKLSLSVRASGNDPKAASAAFQEVQFANEGDLYRVELHEQNVNSNWAYFYHPGIYREVKEIFTERQEPR